MIHAHTNASDLGDVHCMLQAISDFCKVHVLSFEYPGYGLHPGKASVETLEKTTEIVLDFVLDELNICPSRILFYGRSIGSGPMCSASQRLQSKRSAGPAGLILQCGFADFGEVVEDLFGKVVRRLVPASWPNLELVSKLTCPVLIIHGKKDRTISLRHSEKLWDVVDKDRSTFHVADCGHNDFDFFDDFLTPFSTFFQTLATDDVLEGRFQVRSTSLSRPLVDDLVRLHQKFPVWTPEPQGPSSKQIPSRFAGAQPGRHLCETPLPDDLALMLTTDDGMLHLCTQRMDMFLSRLSWYLSSIEGLLEKQFEDVVGIVKAEFWNCDPLLSIYEVVELQADPVVRYRVGPFSIASDGTKSYQCDSFYDSAETSSSVPDMFCVPLWSLSPSYTANVTEWALLHCDALARDVGGSTRRINCARFRVRRQKRKSWPSRQEIARFLAADFISRLRAEPHVPEVLQRFADVYLNFDSHVQMLGSQEDLLKGRAFMSHMRKSLRIPIRLGPNLQKLYDKIWSAASDAEFAPQDPQDSIEGLAAFIIERDLQALFDPMVTFHSEFDFCWAAASVLREYRKKGSRDSDVEGEPSLVGIVNKAMRLFALMEPRMRRSMLSRRRPTRHLAQSETPSMSYAKTSRVKRPSASLTVISRIQRLSSAMKGRCSGVAYSQDCE
eukprot:CAMPEP_0117587774 /NCGR_PEP_ID=MMETSP0784-20121206/69487_1 /TAXON_ID=39447 /ORGANISM="" /LENGTH=666 /DNA_ID=CAMNT_0005389069 /DNA_START=142 /DNA_END=2142 /DNA_ORIENTATION=+